MIFAILGFVYKVEKRTEIYDSSIVVEFQIDEGTASSEILRQLYEQNLIASRINARIYMLKYDKSLYAGTYELSQSMSDKEVIETLANMSEALDMSREFLITEGSTLDVVASDLAKFTVADDSAEEILQYWSDEEVLNEIIANYDFISDSILDDDILYPLEGYFFPATYKLSDEYTLPQITKIFLDTMDDTLENYQIDKYSYHQVLTLASIIERETLLDDDKPIASGVFYNRLQQGMKLQSDITVLYAMQEHKEQVLYEDLKYSSPYNTYLYKGLPPGPISTVSVASIEAAINPEKNDYLYFFADQKTGQLYFSKTIEEHEKISKEKAWDYSQSEKASEN